MVVTTNMFGDILSDEASELSGSLGLAASLNHGADAWGGAGAARVRTVDRGTGGGEPGLPDRLGGHAAGVAGRAAAGMTALEARRSGDRHGGRHGSWREPEGRTRDLGGALGTQGFAEAVIRAL